MSLDVTVGGTQYFEHRLKISVEREVRTCRRNLSKGVRMVEEVIGNAGTGTEEK